VVNSEPPRYEAEELCRFMRDVLIHYGLPQSAAQEAADCLVDADLAGIDTHGVSNFVSHWHYAPGLADGSVNPDPSLVAQRRGNIEILPAERGFGPVVAREAMRRAIALAREAGVGTVVVRDGCHFGAAGYFASLAAREDMIGLVMCPTGPSTIAPGGRDKLVGSNPLAIAAPAGRHHPFVLDMATTAAAGTKLAHARRDNTPIPLGWAVDSSGELTTDPHAAAAGATVPIGYLEGNGHKGFGLALAVDILAGVLSGTGPSAFARYGPDWRQGYHMTAWNVESFLPLAQYHTYLEELVDHIHASTPRSGVDRVALPGDRAARTRARRRVTGIPVAPSVIAGCAALANRTGVLAPRPMITPARGAGPSAGPA
jgi:LDH2 family malate/lactate/ureidoglycolate dehydrogenase